MFARRNETVGPIDAASSSWFHGGAMTPPAEINEFWFGTMDAEGRSGEAHSARWFKRDEAFDREIVERFSATYAMLASGRQQDWLSDAESTIAYVIVLDQFSRNMFRGTAAMFVADEVALQAALGAIGLGFDRKLGRDPRTFLYMPLMHSERLEVQERCVELFQTFADESSGDDRKRLLFNADFAIRHRDIIQRFGRFPHRNAALGRESTPEEVEFLTQPGSSF